MARAPLSSTQRCVLVLGARAPACLEWCRAFKAAGWRVLAADSLHCALARASTAVDGYFRLPAPRRDPRGWITRLAEIVAAEQVALVLPTCEEVFYLAHGRDQIPCTVVVDSLDLLGRLHNKFRFAEWTRHWPGGAPETLLLESSAEVHGFAEDPRDWVFKPVYSRFASRTVIRPDRRRLARITPSSDQPWVAQRHVTGVEHCSFSILRQGRVQAHACYRPRYRVGQGSGIWFEPAQAPGVLTFIAHFGRETGFTGQVGFDFIEDADGALHVLECNPRATSGVHLFGRQPEALVAALLGEAPDGLLLAGPEPRMVALAMLLCAAPRHGLTRNFWADFARAEDVVTRAGDRHTLTAQIPGVLEIALRAVSRGQGLLAAATEDIEWDGQAMTEAACG